MSDTTTTLRDEDIETRFRTAAATTPPRLQDDADGQDADDADAQDEGDGDAQDVTDGDDADAQDA